MIHFFLLVYPILGAGLKYIDDAFDEKTFNRKIALMLAPFIGVLWAYAMIIDQVSATILLAVLLGVFIKGKIDNQAHIIGLIVIILFVILLGLDLMILPLILLVAATMLDEVGNDIIDYNKENLNENKFLHRVFTAFFDQRWLTKLVILYVVFVGLFPWYFFVAMLLFDGAYIVVRIYSKSLLKSKPITC